MSHDNNKSHKKAGLHPSLESTALEKYGLIILYQQMNHLEKPYKALECLH